MPKSRTFLVASRALIIKNNRVLVIKVPEIKEKDFIGDWNGKWSIPGGLLEIDEDIKKGLLREVREETDLRVKIKKLFGMGEMRHKGFTFKDKRKLDVRVVELGFLCDYVSGEVKLSEEHQEYKWANKNELKNLEFSPDSKDLLEQYFDE